jgi:hypothetical protein
VHVGGGEPVIDVDGLVAVAGATRGAELVIDYADLGSPLDEQRYPVLSALRRGGRALLDSAEPWESRPSARGHLSTCQLCDAVRRHLVVRSRERWPELRLLGFYPGAGTTASPAARGQE